MFESCKNTAMNTFCGLMNNTSMCSTSIQVYIMCQLFSLFRSREKPTWLHPRELIWEAKQCFCCSNVDRITMWSLLMGIVAHFLCFQTIWLSHFVSPLTVCIPACVVEHGQHFHWQEVVLLKIALEISVAAIQKVVHIFFVSAVCAHVLFVRCYFAHHTCSSEILLINHSPLWSVCSFLVTQFLF